MEVTKKIVVDLWKTGAHKVEVGIKKNAENRAKSRQFTKDMDIIGEVNRDDKDAGYIAYRQDPWEEEIPKKRIVLKHFTEGMSWKASMEELISRGITNSIAANRGLPVFIVNISKLDYLVTIEKIIRRKLGERDIFSFSLIDEETLENQAYTIEAERVSIGSDWTVYNQRHEQIAELDGKGFNIGGKYEIKINENIYGYTTLLDQMLILFAGMTRFLEDVEKKLEKTLEMIQKGETTIIIEKEEAFLYMNPRRVAM